MGAPAPTASRRRPAEVRQLLLDAAAAEFARHGYVDAKMRTIASEADVAMSAMYRHFPTKSELFREAVLLPFLAFIGEFGATWRQQLNQPWEAERLMRAMIEYLYDNLTAHRKALTSLVAASGQPDLDVMADLRAAMTQMFSELQLIGEHEAAVRGWFSPSVVPPATRLAVALTIGMVIAEPWLTEDGVGWDGLVGDMANFCLYGIKLGP
ncbi:MAG: TetR/AcrR family transcriptional regulator [Acidimicrobiia bacterium]